MGKACLALLRHEGLAGGLPCPPLIPDPPLPPRPCRYEVKALGYKLMQAMHFAVEEINNHSSLLPGVRLGYEMVDTCYVSNNVQPVLYFLAQEDYLLPVQEDYSRYVPRVVAVIGPENSEATITVAHILSLFLLPQVRSRGPRRGAGRGRRGGCPGGSLPHTRRRGKSGGQSRSRMSTPILGKRPGLSVESSGFGGRLLGVCLGSESCPWIQSLRPFEPQFPQLQSEMVYQTTGGMRGPRGW